MYRPTDRYQQSFLDFDQLIGYPGQAPFDVSIHLLPLDISLLRVICSGQIRNLEFGAKFDLSVYTESYGRIEKIFFDAYNEGGTLQEVAEHFRERTGHYPERIPAVQI